MNLLDVKVDFVFKKIFGDEHNLDILLHFINTVFRDSGHPEIVEIALVPTQLQPDYADDKQSILDIQAKTKDGVRINIEMQFFNKRNFPKRTLFYWSHLYYHQLQKGQEYDELKRCVTINVLNFNLVKNERPHNTFQLREMMTYVPFNDDLEIHTLELPKLAQYGGTIDQQLRNWLLFLLDANAPEMGAIRMDEAMLDKAMEALEMITQDDISRAQFFARDKYLRDQASFAALKEGVKLAQQQLQEGQQQLQEGQQQLQEGQQQLQEGQQQLQERQQRLQQEQQQLQEEFAKLEKTKAELMAQVIAEGKMAQQYAIARNMLQAGMDVAMIATVTQLSEQEINRLT